MPGKEIQKTKIAIRSPLSELENLKEEIKEALQNIESPSMLKAEESRNIYLFFALGVTQLEKMSNNLILKFLIDEKDPKVGGKFLGEIFRKSNLKREQEKIDGLLGIMLGTGDLDRVKILKILEKLSQSDREEIMRDYRIIDGELKNKMSNFRGTRNDLVHNAGRRYTAPKIEKGEKDFLTLVEEGWGVIEKIDNKRRFTVTDLAYDVKTPNSYKETIMKKKPISFSSIKNPWVIGRKKKSD